MLLCCNASASPVNKLLTPTHHNCNCPCIHLLYRDFCCLNVTFCAGCTCFNILLYLCTLLLFCYTCVYCTQLCLLYVYIVILVVISYIISYILVILGLYCYVSCYASPTTKNGSLNTPGKIINHADYVAVKSSQMCTTIISKSSTPFCTTLIARVKYLCVQSRLRSLYNLWLNVLKLQENTT